MIDNVKLTEIKQRAENATSGPWASTKVGESTFAIDSKTITSAFYLAFVEKECNAEFIAHAYEDIPLLVAEIERLQLAIRYSIEITQDDDVWDYLQNVLQGTEQNAHIFNIGGKRE